MLQLWYIEILSTWEVLRALKRLNLLEAHSYASFVLSLELTGAQCLDLSALTHELIC